MIGRIHVQEVAPVLMKWFVGKTLFCIIEPGEPPARLVCEEASVLSASTNVPLPPEIAALLPTDTLVQIHALAAGERLQPEQTDTAGVFVLLAGNGRLPGSADGPGRDFEPGSLIDFSHPDSPSLAALELVQDSRLLFLKQDVHKLWRENNPDVKQFLNRLITAQLHRSYLLQILIQLFGTLPKPLEETIFAQVTWQQLQPGEILYHDGDPAEDMAIILTGRLQVSIREQEQERVLMELPHGDLALNLAIVCLDDNLRGAVSSILEQIAVGNTTFTLDEAAFQQRFSAEPFSAENSESGSYLDFLLNIRLSELETSHEFLFLEADREWNDWTRRCLQHADQLLLIGAAGSGSQPRPVEKIIQDRFPFLPTSLILVHPPQTVRPQGTQAWLTSRRLTSHYHVRQGDAQHSARLARLLTSQAYGLVLSGGGAVGLAHIGVLQTIEESAFPIDLIGGTSMGALIAGGYAMGRTPAELRQFALETFYRSLLVNSKNHFWSVQHLVDHLLSIDQTGYSYLDLARHAELIQLGYETAGPTLTAHFPPGKSAPKTRADAS